MHLERDGRGRLQQVRKPKDKESYGRPRPTGNMSDPQVRIEPREIPIFNPGKGNSHPPPNGTRLPDRSRRPPTDGTRDPRVSTAPGSNRYPPRRDLEDHPPARDPPRGTRPPARLPSPVHPAYRDQPQRFNVKRVIIRDPEELFEEASWDISPTTGTDYPCTQRDLDACGGKSRRASARRDRAELRAMWFSQPNRESLVSVRTASRDIFEHNDLDRIPSAKEDEAISRLLTMFDSACHDSWGPDLAIKAFCDLDTVFFRGKLRGHVCISWAGQEVFLPGSSCFGHAKYLGQGKALIQLNAQFIFVDWGTSDGRLFTQTLATVLHEMIHAYQMVKCLEHGKDGFVTAQSGPSEGHGKNFGTMMLAVNARAFELLGLKGDPTKYPFHNYNKGEGFPQVLSRVACNSRAR